MRANLAAASATTAAAFATPVAAEREARGAMTEHAGIGPAAADEEGTTTAIEAAIDTIADTAREACHVELYASGFDTACRGSSRRRRAAG